MKLALEVAKKNPCAIPKRFFEKVAKEALERSGLGIESDVTVSLSVALVSLEEIRSLNKTYRKKNRPTDVLSFGNFSGRNGIVPDAERRIVLGELVLSPQFIADAAEEDGVTIEQEMAYIFSHGIFHLLGFRHCPLMFRLQDEIAFVYSNGK